MLVEPTSGHLRVGRVLDRPLALVDEVHDSASLLVLLHFGQLRLGAVGVVLVERPRLLVHLGHFNRRHQNAFLLVVHRRIRILLFDFRDGLAEVHLSHRSLDRLIVFSSVGVLHNVPSVGSWVYGLENISCLVRGHAVLNERLLNQVSVVALV